LKGGSAVILTSILERIMQIGKKKLVLDHLIVQKMDDNDENGGENVQSILTYGAQAIFDSEQEARDITCNSYTFTNHCDY
jgi:chromodomain-helicase-DNA-binding protein 4